MKIKKLKLVPMLLITFQTINYGINTVDQVISNIGIYEIMGNKNIYLFFVNLFSLIIIMITQLEFVKRGIVWVEYKLGRLDINYTLKMTIKSSSLEKLKHKLNKTFEETGFFDAAGGDILVSEPDEYKCNYSSLGSVLEIKKSSQNDVNSTDKNYELKLKGKIAFNCLNNNIEFFKDFLDAMEVEKISLQFFEENTNLSFVNRDEFSSIKKIKEIEKELRILTKTSAEIHIYSKQGLAYLTATKKIDFFSTYNDFKELLIR